MKDQTGVRADAYFSIVPEWLLDHADIGPRAIQLYAVLGRYADQQGKAFPSRRTLARRCRCSVGAVDTARRELEAAGALVVERRMSDDDGQETNLYTVIRGNPLAAHDEAPLSADGQPPLSAGWEENESHHEPEPSEPETHGELALAYDPVKGTRIDGRNLPWDSLVAETGADERIEKGKIARALKTIRTVCAADYNLGAN